jgi:hypothetical protein
VEHLWRAVKKLDETGQKYEIWKSGNLLLGENDTIWLVAR